MCSGAIQSYGLKKKAEAVKKCREIGKKDMKLNDAMPKMSGEWGFGGLSECADVASAARRNATWKSPSTRGCGWKAEGG